jgi:mannose-6-phosphate isomerase-like protein (cupin superfamily)
MKISNNISESMIPGIELAFRIGGENKKNFNGSIHSWHTNTEQRIQEIFNILFTKYNCKLKELVIAPKKGMSFQSHLHRSEIRFIIEGACKFNFQSNKAKQAHLININSGDFEVPILAKYQIFYHGQKDCVFMKIQYGKRVDELDTEYFFATLKSLQRLQCLTFRRLDGRVVMQRPAKPCTPVRFRLQPPPTECQLLPRKRSILKHYVFN